MDLYKRGVPISSEGSRIADWEKQRMFKPQNCIAQYLTTGPPNSNSVRSGLPQDYKFASPT